jgi:NTE family protein
LASGEFTSGSKAQESSIFERLVAFPNQRIDNKPMRFSSVFLSFVLVWIPLLGGCATRPVNPPIAKYDTSSLQQVQKQWHRGDPQDIVILAFSGGGTRAAAFSYGVLETLRSMHLVTSTGRQTRLLDEVDVITGVSGGSMTALAYGLYGEKLFDDYPARFLKRDVQGELVSRILNPIKAGSFAERSEIAANLYDEILFNGATFADLYNAGGPMIAVSATELGTGARIVFIPQNFDVMCADLHPIRLSRAAAASSAVPVVLAPLTINNYGGSCDYQPPQWLRAFAELSEPPRPAARALNRLHELQELDNGVEDPYFHLVDGGISDNLGLRSVLDVLETYEAMHDAGQPTPLDGTRSIIIFVVNSLPKPSTDWNKSEAPPATIDVLLKSAGLPIERYSGEMVEQLRDINARWRTLRAIRGTLSPAQEKDPAMKEIVNAPSPDIYVVDVSFSALQDESERDYLYQLPTSFNLPDEAVDRLRAAARSLIVNSPDLQQALRDQGARIVEPPVAQPSPAVSIPAAPR